MVSFTVNEWAVLLLVFVLGWLLGLMSRSGGRRWRRELEDERAEHAAYRRDVEARLAERDAEFGHRAVPAAPAHETVRFRKDGRPV